MRLSPIQVVAVRRVVRQTAGDARLFAQPCTLDRADALAHDQDLAARVEAVVGRFAGLQDMLGDKSLPRWLQARQLRNRLVPGYFDIDTELVWRTVADELPGLIVRLREKLGV